MGDVPELHQRLERLGLSAEAVEVIDLLAQERARELAEAEVASLAGLVLQTVKEAKLTNRTVAYRTSGVVKLTDAITSAFAERLGEARR